MENFFGGLIAIIISVFLGCGVKKFLDCAIPKLKRLDKFPEDKWESMTEHPGYGSWIGLFERMLFLISFWLGEYEIIGGWLLFKVASKWQTWNSLIKVPEKIDGELDASVWYQFQKRFGSWVLSRFLIGTLVNILIAALAYYLGKNFLSLVKWISILQEAA